MKMLWDNVLVKDIAKKGKVIVMDRIGSMPNKGEVVAIGPGDYYGYPALVKTGSDVCNIKAGDKVFFSKDRAMEIEIKGEKLWIIRSRDLLGVLDEEEALSIAV